MKKLIARLKDKLQSTSISTIILSGVIVLFIIGAIVALIATIYINGGTLGGFLSKYYAWFILGVAVLIIVIMTIALQKARKGK